MVGPGTMVTPEVKLLRALDAGAMGSIWVAEHGGRGKEVAVKLMTDALRAADPSLLDRFKREAAVLRQVDNEHIVQSYGQGTMDDGTPYIVMELLDGGNVVTLLERRGEWLGLAEVDALVAQLGDALAHIHQFDIVHRDLKAENVLVVQNEPLRIKLIDFGLAKVPDIPGHAALTMPGMLVGSAEYMSPEQIVSASTVGHHADLWGMAVCVYVCLTGSLPFTGDLADMFMAIRNGKFAAPSALRGEMPPSVDAWFARAFHPKRGERFPSAGDMVAAWKEARAGKLLAGEAPTRRIDPLIASVVGAVLLLALIVAVILLA